MKNYCFAMLFACLATQLFGQVSISKETQSYISHNNGDIIEAIGKDLPIPKNTTVINMEGKSAIPGMVMLHEHLFYPKSTPGGSYGVNQMSYSFPKLYLAGGITSMRTAGSIMPQSDINIKKAILEGKIPGPKMDVTSPHLDREGTGILELGPFTSTEQAVKMVDFYIEMGATSIKVYNFISKIDLKAIVDAALKKGVKVTGHLCSVTYKEAADIGIDNLEHGFFASSDFIANKEPDACEPFNQHKSLLELPVDSKEMSNLINQIQNANLEKVADAQSKIKFDRDMKEAEAGELSASEIALLEDDRANAAIL